MLCLRRWIKICQTAYFQFKRISSVRRFSLKTQPRLLLLSISSHGLTTVTVSSWVYLILSSTLSRKFKTFAARLVLFAPCRTAQHLSWGKKTKNKKQLRWFPILESIKYKVACVGFNAINGFGLAYLSELLHV